MTPLQTLIDLTEVRITDWISPAEAKAGTGLRALAQLEVRQPPEHPLGRALPGRMATIASPDERGTDVVEVADQPGRHLDAAADHSSCRDCGNSFRTEWDHVRPRAAHGPASTTNLEPRCWRCHKEKTARDRRAGQLRPP